MDEVLLFLFKEGGDKKEIKITTNEIGRATGMSQQNASLRLRKLLDDGLVERKKRSLRITTKGMNALMSYYFYLKQIFEKKNRFLLGRIVKGFGRGRYYVSNTYYKKELKKRLGFVPFPGTLNICLEKKEIKKREDLLRMEPMIIQGYKTKRRTFGELYLYPCRIEGYQGAVVFPLRSNHPPQIIEVLAEVNLKDALKKKEGDRVKVDLC